MYHYAGWDSVYSVLDERSLKWQSVNYFVRAYYIGMK